MCIDPVVEDLLDLVDQRLALLHGPVSRAWRWKRSSTSGMHAGGVDAALADVGLEPRGRVAADAPVMPTITFLSFFSRHAVRNAARSMVRIFVRMPDGLEIAGQGLAHRES